MTEPEATPGPEPTRCPWCSAAIDDVTAPTCLSCGAALHETVDADLPGVTQVDAAAVVAQRRARRPGVRSLIGLTDDETEGSPARALPTPPSEEVRREMLRLRIDALEAEIEAQAAALAAARAEAAAAGLPMPASASAASESAPAEPTVAGPEADAPS